MGDSGKPEESVFFQGTKAMTRIERNAYWKRLHAMAGRLGRELRAIEDEARQSSGGEASGGFSDVPVHPADLGSRETEEVVNLSLLDREQMLLAEIDAAIGRLRRGTFGECDACHRPIGKVRLRAVPYTRHCAMCAGKEEAIAALP
jgi:DnaK suppressor protein